MMHCLPRLRPRKGRCRRRSSAIWVWVAVVLAGEQDVEGDAAASETAPPEAFGLLQGLGVGRHVGYRGVPTSILP